MSDINEAVQEVIVTGKAILIPCGDQKNQESVRVMCFQLKRKMKGLAEDISITKVEKDDMLYVKIYKRQNSVLYTEDENGNIVPLNKGVAGLSEESKRQIRMMLGDNKDREEIIACVEGEETAIDLYIKQMSL